METNVKPPWLAELNPKSAVPSYVKAPVVTPQEVAATTINSTFGKLGPVSPLYDAGVAEAITKIGQDLVRQMVNPNPVPNTSLPFLFDATKFAESAAQSRAAASEQLHGNEPAPGDSPFGSLFNNDDHIKPEDFPSYPEPEPVTVIPSIAPFEGAEPPINAVAAGPEVPWLTRMSREMSSLYDSHVMAIMQVNPLRASYLMRIKGYNSKYVGIITDPGLAELHIRACDAHGEDVGGWDDKFSSHIRKGQAQLEVGAKIKRKVEDRTRFNLEIALARQAWKGAIAERANKMELLNTEVANRHAAYNLIKTMPFDEWVSQMEAGDAY